MKHKKDTDAQAASEALWETLGLEALEPQAEGGFAETLRWVDEESAGAFEETGAQPSAEAHASLAFPTLPRLSLGEARDAAAEQGEPLLPRKDLELQGLLGEGGMGQVHLARQRSLGRDVAIKRSKSHESARLLLHEGYVTGHLEHPNIIPVHALGQDQSGAPVIVMKRVEGVSWRELIYAPDHDAWEQVKAWTTDPIERHTEILLEVCSAVAFAHSKGYLHLDIKPDNVMLGSFGEIYLLDWGIAQESGSQGSPEAPGDGRSLYSFAGTPTYMPPEMLARDRSKLDERSDVYLLGATLHEALTQSFRHQGDTLPELLYAISNSAPIEYGPEIPRELAAICNKATHKHPDSRFPTVMALRGALIEFLKHRGSTLLSDEAHEKLQQFKPLLQQMPATASTQDIEASDRAHGVMRLFQECMFGFEHALRQWPENPGAKEGLQETLEAMIRFELQRGNFDMTRAMLRELPQANPALEQQLVQAERRWDAEQREGEALRKMAHELDPELTQQTRLKFVAGISGLVLAIAILVLLISRSQAMDHTRLLVFSTSVVLFIGGVLFALRKRLFANAYSTSFTVILICYGGFLWLHRVLMTSLGHELHSILLGDLMLVAAITTIAGFSIRKLLLPLASFQLVMVLLIFAFPKAALPLILSAAVISLSTLSLLVWRGKA